MNTAFSIQEKNRQVLVPRKSKGHPFPILPKEITYKILNQLDWPELACTTYVSKFFYQFWAEKLNQRFNKKKTYKNLNTKYKLSHLFLFIKNNGFKINYLNLYNINKLNDQRLKLIVINCPNLIGLRINSKQITDKSILMLKNLKYLERLTLNECLGISKKTFFSFKKIKKLSKLYLFNNHLTDEELIFLTTIKTIEKLVLTGNQQISKIAIPSLLKLPKLKSLALADYSNSLLNQESLNLMEKLTTLEKLDLLYLKGQDLNFTPLTNLPKLHNMYLHFCELKSENLSCIAKIENLRTLFLHLCKRCHPDVELDFSRFLNFKKLERLELIKFDVNEINLVFLTQLENLRSLSFYKCSFTTVAVSKITAFQSLYDKGKSPLAISCSNCNML